MYVCCMDGWMDGCAYSCLYIEPYMHCFSPNGMRVSVCVCMCVRTHKYIHIYVYINSCTSSHMSACIHTHTQAVPGKTSWHVYIIYIYIYTYIHTYIHTHIHKQCLVRRVGMFEWFLMTPSHHRYEYVHMSMFLCAHVCI
jgi:hypothetical protein